MRQAIGKSWCGLLVGNDDHLSSSTPSLLQASPSGCLLKGSEGHLYASYELQFTVNVSIKGNQTKIEPKIEKIVSAA